MKSPLPFFSFFVAIAFLMGLLVLVGCQNTAVTPTPLIQTVVYYDVLELPMTQVVTRQIEVTRLVIVTREVEKVVTVTPSPAATPTLSNGATVTPTLTALVIQPATLFAEATATSPQLLIVEEGSVVELLGRSANKSWVYIQLADGVRGFASVSRLKLSVDVDMLPLATPPTP